MTRAAYPRAAVSPRMLGLLLALLAVAAVCGRLGVWQLDRAQLRGAAAAERGTAERAAAPAVPLDDVLVAQTALTGDGVGRKVEVSGTFEADGLLVAGRVLDDRTGYLVLTPLRVGDAVLPVVRGWVPDPSAVQPPPPGPVRVVGYLQAGEAAGDEAFDAISPAELVNRWGGPIYSAYLVLASVDPPQDEPPAVLPPPTVQGSGVNLQNLAYALQWWIFAGFAVLIWLRMVRDEARASVAGGPDADRVHDRRGE